MRDPFVSDSVSLTCGPIWTWTQLTVDLVNVDQVNTDVIKGHDDVSIWRTPCRRQQDTWHSLVLPRVALCVFFSENLYLILKIILSFRKS